MEARYKQYFCLVIMFFLSAKLSAQQLNVGDTVPDIRLSNIINYTKESANLSDFKKKLTILDFWSTRCVGCIEAFPHLDSLQRKFAGKIQIIAVDGETKKWLLDFLSKHKKIKLPSSFPLVMGDTILYHYFPYSFAGLYIWLDSNLVVRQRTYSWNLTERNILKYLSGEQLKLLQEKYVKNAIISEPIVKELAARTDYYSIITHAVSGVTIHNGIERTPNGKIFHIWRGDVPIIQLFITAYSEDGKYNIIPRSTWIFRGIDTTHLFFPAADSLIDNYRKNYCYNYELKVPAREADHSYEFMQQDLTRYFGIKGQVTKKRVKCLVLVRKTTEEEIEAKMNTAAKQFNRSMLDSAFIVKDSTMKGFMNNYLKSVFIGNKIQLPLIDKTGYKGPVAMIIPNKIFNPYLNLDKFRKVLREYGFDLIAKQKRSDVLIFEEE